MINGKNMHNTKIFKVYQFIRYQLLARHFYAITGPFRVLPNFIIIGGVRCGTTSLYYDLCQHPSILSATYDEIGFFDSNYHLGLNWYRSMFPTKFEISSIKKKQNLCITGEDTPFYFWKKSAAKRIAELLPNVKLIVILRNPIDRAHSEYQWTLKSGGEKIDDRIISFEEAIEDELGRIESAKEDGVVKDYTSLIKHQSSLTKGIYADQLQIWFNRFPRDQILVIRTEDLSKEPEQTLNDVFSFLGLPNYKIKNMQKQKIGHYPPMKDNTRKFLIEFFRPHNERLYKMMNRNFEWDK